MPKQLTYIYAQGYADDTPGHAGIGLIFQGVGLPQELMDNFSKDRLQSTMDSPCPSASSAFVSDNINSDSCDKTITGDEQNLGSLAEYIGIASAPQAHCQAFIRALNYTSDHKLSPVIIYTDNNSLLQSLQLKHIATLEPALSSLHKRILRAAKYQDVDFRFASSEKCELQQALLLAKRATVELRQNEQGDKTSVIPGSSERHALQQSAGGIVYRRHNRHVQVCLIAKKKGQIWALPKGRLRPGESWEATAVREVLEETGHLATIEDYVDQIDYCFYWKENHTIYYKLVAFFLMPVIIENHAPPDGEADKIAWFDIDNAIHLLHYQSEHHILRQARSMLIK